MPTLYTTTTITAPRSFVWAALFHKEHWLHWNTFLFDRNPSQPFVQGAQVQLSLKRPHEETEIEFAPRVILLQPEVCLRWVYTAPGFRCEHSFELQDIDRCRTKYVHQESVSGVMSRMVLPFFRQDEQAGLRQMARELKSYVEARAGVHCPKIVTTHHK